jgi:hypothetical protein
LECDHDLSVHPIPRAPVVAASSEQSWTVQAVFAAFQARPNRGDCSEWGPTHGAAGLPITRECTLYVAIVFRRIRPGRGI